MRAPLLVAPVPVAPLLVAALLSIAAPSVGQAQSSPATAAILPNVGGSGGVDAAAHDARTAAITLLRDERIVVIEPLDVQAQLDETQRACAPDAPCTRGIRAQLGVDYLVGLTLDAQHEVRVSILATGDASYSGSAPVSDGDIVGATRDALRTAVLAMRRGPGPFLRIDGTAGGVCVLDGTPLGTIPLEARVPPGEHELQVTLEGHAPYRVSVTVEGDPMQTTEIEVALHPAAGRDSSADWALPTGIALMIAGVGVGVAVPVGAAASAGCVEGSPCTRYNEVDVGAVGAWVAVGGALLATGVVFTIVAAAAGSQPSVQARVAPSGVTVEGRF